MAELEQFCLLARTLKGKACVVLIQQVISHSKIFHFGELLSIPSIQGLSETEYSSAVKTLELFAYGTFQDYISAQSNFLELNQTQINKLKLLSLITLGRTKSILSYSFLQENLQIQESRELELLIIEGIYNNLYNGKLDQKAKVFKVHSCTTRDVRPEEIDIIINKLTEWKQTCLHTAAIITDNNHIMQSTREKDVATKEAIQNHINKTVVQIINNPETEDHEDGELGHFASRSRGKRTRGQPQGSSSSSSSSSASMVGMGLSILTGSKW